MGRPQPDLAFLKNLLEKGRACNDPTQRAKSQTGLEGHGMVVFTRVLGMHVEEACELC